MALALLFDVYVYEHIHEILSWLMVSNNTKSIVTGDFGQPIEAYNIVHDLNHVVANFKRYYGISREELFQLPLLEYYSLLNAIMFEENSLTSIIKYRTVIPKADDDIKYKRQMNQLKRQYRIPSGKKTTDRLNDALAEQANTYNEIAKEVGING
jgi:hypothetical protein